MILNHLSDTSIGGDLLLPESRVPLYSLLVAESSGEVAKIKLAPSALKQTITGKLLLPTASDVIMGSAAVPLHSLNVNVLVTGATLQTSEPAFIAMWTGDPSVAPPATRPWLSAISWADFKAFLGGGGGTQGPKGDPGEKWFTGDYGGASPSGSLAGSIQGDWALDSNGGNYWEKVSPTSWTLRGNLRGQPGTNGTNGTNGTPGENWFTGSGSPSGSLAGSIVGDWYLDSATGDYYEKTASAAWTLRGNLKGPKGDTGNSATVGPGTVGTIAVWGSTTTTLRDSTIKENATEVTITARNLLLTAGNITATAILATSNLGANDTVTAGQSLVASVLFTHGGVQVPIQPTGAGNVGMHGLMVAASPTGNSYLPLTLSNLFGTQGPHFFLGGPGGLGAGPGSTSFRAINAIDLGTRVGGSAPDSTDVLFGDMVWRTAPTGGGGSGTVMSVAVTPTSSFTTSVATPTTTPNISLALSSAVVGPGSITATTSLNAATIALTGNATITAPNNSTLTSLTLTGATSTGSIKLDHAPGSIANSSLLLVSGGTGSIRMEAGVASTATTPVSASTAALLTIKCNNNIGLSVDGPSVLRAAITTAVSHFAAWGSTPVGAPTTVVCITAANARVSMGLTEVVGWRTVTIDTGGSVTGTVASGGVTVPTITGWGDAHEFSVTAPTATGSYALRISVRPPVDAVDASGIWPVFQRVADSGGNHVYHVWAVSIMTVASNPGSVAAAAAAPISILTVELVR